MRPLAALLLLAASASAQGHRDSSAGQPTQTAATTTGGRLLCDARLDGAKAAEIQSLINCLQFCPTPGGADGCKSGRNGVNPISMRRGGVFDERLACKVHLANSPGEIETVVASVSGEHWAQGKCPQEHGYAASLVFERAKSDDKWYRAALTIMMKGSVKGARFAPLLYQALKSPDAKTKALALSLLRRNFINAPDEKDRVSPPNDVLVPLMYDADPTVSAQAVAAVADRIRVDRRPGSPRLDDTLALIGPVIGPNDRLNPLPAGMPPASPAARKAGLDELDRNLVGVDAAGRYRVLKHLMRLQCEDEKVVHKAAFELYYKILTPHADDLRRKIPDPRQAGATTTKELLLRTELYDALFATGDMGSSPASKGGGYADNCIGPMRAN